MAQKQKRNIRVSHQSKGSRLYVPRSALRVLAGPLTSNTQRLGIFQHRHHGGQNLYNQ